ncbi:MAG: stress response translation initiation inhibitor YciH [Thermoprotei archaeon]|nr:MAG: stress response translation initiation inhibitor YciH [Thermoprotei archaeon]
MAFEEICPRCGLPKELCVCQTIVKEQQLIRIRLERRRGHEVTIIEGLDPKSISLKELASQLKSKLACGGTAKEGRIELQGDHRYKVREILINLGFSPDNIMVE